MTLCSIAVSAALAVCAPLPYAPRHSDDGPFAVKGDGTIGYVLRYDGDILIFQPCYGRAFLMRSEQLEETKLTCNDARPS